MSHLAFKLCFGNVFRLGKKLLGTHNHTDSFYIVLWVRVVSAVKIKFVHLSMERNVTVQII